MRRRGLDIDVVRQVIERPDAWAPVRPGRLVLQATIPSGSPPGAYLVRVFVDVDRDPMEVVTAYRTSKLNKYGRPAAP